MMEEHPEGQHPAENHDNDRMHYQMPPLLRIQDLDSWVEQYGLQEPEYGIASSLDQSRIRVGQERLYQQSVHDAIFGKIDQNDNDIRKERNGCHQGGDHLLEQWNHETLEIQTRTSVIRNVPLRPLASVSDTVFAMAASRRFFGYQKNRVVRNHVLSDDKDCDKDNGNNNQPPMVLSLKSFDLDAVESFLEAVVGKTPPQLIHPDHIVACCQISHYLQCNSLLSEIVDILINSIDTANCLSFCQLADALNLPRLFEQSLGYMMKTLGDIQEHNQVWEDLTPELRERILTIKYAIQTSIHSQNRGRIYFGSLTEYLAIFAENIQYHRERLAEAKERQRELTKDSSSPAWKYAQRKIEKHEQRLRTLEIVMEEQKKLFGGAVILEQNGVIMKERT